MRGVLPTAVGSTWQFLLTQHEDAEAVDGSQSALDRDGRFWGFAPHEAKCPSGGIEGPDQHVDGEAPDEMAERGNKYDDG